MNQKKGFTRKGAPLKVAQKAINNGERAIKNGEPKKTCISYYC